jgi:hypothetical protein
VHFQRRDAAPARFSSDTSRGLPALHPFDCRTGAYVEPLGRFAWRTASWPSIGTLSKTRPRTRHPRAACPCSEWHFPRNGPDFISRLRGHINIADANAQPGRSKHFLRRAVQLRGLLENKLKLVESDSARAKIDEAVIYALLTIDRYHHGVRSMEAILRMCAPIALNDNHIYISSVPARAQLNMHVDADEFAIRIRRGRARAAKFAAKPAVA